MVDFLVSNSIRELMCVSHVFDPVWLNLYLGHSMSVLLFSCRDLSFNKLEGNIPDLRGLGSLELVCLSNNLLTGNIPDWIKDRDYTHQIDLSYNNFSEQSAPSCRDSLNLFRSFSGGKNLELGGCQKDFPCSKDHYSLHINCGGEETRIGNIVYEEDKDEGGPAKFLPKKDNWGFSSSGHFWDGDKIASDYIATNVSILKMNYSELYTTARLSPLSLTYYGRCLADGNYSVKLHFAEIIMRDNESFHSLGRRIFYVYIQTSRFLLKARGRRYLLDLWLWH